MYELVLLCGLPGSGKSTYCGDHLPNHVRVSRDDQGNDGHRRLFADALKAGQDIVVDKVNFNHEQRAQWITPARAAGYRVKIVWLKVDRLLCEKRCANRAGHPTVDPSKVNPAHIISKFTSMWREPTQKECDDLVVIHAKHKPVVKDLTHLTGRIAVFGDLHGVYDEFIKALVATCPDHIVLCGDINDRGPDFTKLQRFCREQNIKGKLHAVEGNHEKALLRAINTSAKEGLHGLSETLAEVRAMDDEEREALRLYLQKLPGMLQLPMGRWVVHAGVDPRRKPSDQSYSDVMYVRRLGGATYNDKTSPWWFEHQWHADWQDQVVLFGHSYHDNPLSTEQAVSLDGYAVFGKQLRCYVMDTDKKTTELLSFGCRQYAEEDPAWST